MLESAGFDFRNRYPQKLMVKLARALRFDKDTVAKTAWNLSVDMYRTFAPLKQTTPTMAIACLELAARLHDIDTSRLVDAGVVRYTKWHTSRAEVMGQLFTRFWAPTLMLTTRQKRSSTFLICTRTTAI